MYTFNYTPEGIWSGGNRESYFFVRNAGPAVKEEYEEWFV